MIAPISPVSAGRTESFANQAILATSESSLGHRQMLPPSPPQPYPARSASVSHSQNSPSLFSRDHGLPSQNRPGASMSISSMLGSEPDRPARDSTASIFSRPSLSTSSFLTSRQPAGGTQPSNGPHRPAPSLENPLLRRSQTPDKPYNRETLSRQSSRSDSAGLSDSSKFAFGRSPFSQNPDKPSNSQKSPPSTAAAEPSFDQSRRASFHLGIQRPSSQPQHDELRSSIFSPRSRTSADSILTNTRRAASYLDHDTRPPFKFGGLYSDRAREEQQAREREQEKSSVNETDRKPFGFLQGRFGVRPTDREDDRPPNRTVWETGRSQPQSPQARRFVPTNEAATRPGFGFGAIQNYTKTLGSQLGTSRSAPAVPTSRQPFSLPSNQGQTAPTSHEQPSVGRNPPQPRPLSITSIPGNSQSTGGVGSGVEDQQRRKGSDDLLQHRNLLGIGADGKRAGRASPLPQAVQGAQAQFIGSVGEPGIKGDLGRVFAGIGSGVGTGASSSTGSGSPTPMTVSPFKRDNATGPSDNVEEGNAGHGSATLGRKRSARDDDSPVDVVEQSQDLRGTSSTRGGSRRGRHVHHHHQYVYCIDP